MANIIKPKRSNTAGLVPTTSNLSSGELGVNMADQKVYINNGTAVVQVGAGNLSGLDDVSITTPTSGQSLQYDGTNWVNSTGGTGDVVGGSSSTDNALARYDGTTGKLIQNSVVVVNDSGTMSGVESLTFDGSIPATTPVGTFWYDSSTETLNFQQNNITQQIGEEILLYGKASSAINDSPLQIIYQTGVVGASGVITFAPTVAGITDANLILGCATEAIATNSFGRITTYGTVHNITTNGTAYGETWADGDVIWYNPVTGNPTKTKPTAPNIKVQLGIVTHAGNGGSGSFQVLIRTGSELGGTDSNVNITSATGGQLLSYDQTAGYWKNINLTDGTGISITETTGGAITVANTGVTSVGATSPIASSGGATPTISISQATTSTNGYLSSTDWNTFNNKGSGTVTSVTGGSYLTGGTITSSGTLAVDATSANTASKVVARDASGNFSAGTITATLSGNASTATSATTATTATNQSGGTVSATTGSFSGVVTSTVATGTAPFTIASTTLNTNLNADYLDGQHGSYYQPASTAITTSNIGSQSVNYATTAGSATSATTATQVSNSLTASTGLSGTTFNGSSAQTWTLASSGVSANTYGSSTAIPVITVDTYGRITSASTATVSGGQYFGTATTKAIAYNANSISENITVTAGNNGLSAGPITINTGYTVTVQTGANWVIV